MAKALEHNHDDADEGFGYTHYMKMDIRSWRRLMAEFGFKPNDNFCQQLIRAHAETHRAYHTAEHINACLSHLDAAQHLALRPHEIALALWFHDAIYKPFADDNERASANLALGFLKAQSAPQDMRDRIEALIMATEHGVENLTGDLAVMVDVDLSILGAATPIYNRYEKDIRFEYRRVPGFIFKRKRKKLLQQFLERPRLYFTDHFHTLWDKQARINLRRAIGGL